jgi:hypothetical protein
MVDILNVIDPWAFDYVGLGVYKPSGDMCGDRLLHLQSVWREISLDKLFPELYPTEVQGGKTGGGAGAGAAGNLAPVPITLSHPLTPRITCPSNLSCARAYRASPPPLSPVHPV